MQAILAVTVPFFALVLCGYLAAQRRFIPESAIPGLNGFVLFFALPCMLFRFGASMPFAQLIDPALIGVYLASALLMVFFTIAATLQRGPGGAGVTLRDAAFGALVAAFPNTGFMGVPLLVAMLGERAAGPIIGTVLIDLIFTSTLCLAVAQHQPVPTHGAGAAGNGNKPSAGRGATLRALRGAMTNPLPWSIALGALLAASGQALPGPVAQVVKMLGDAATPVALFTIGTVLWRAGQHSQSRTPLGHFLPVALVKLLIHPALVLSLGLLARAAGVAVPSFGLLVMVLGAALPSASNVSLLAERYGADNGRVARIIMASTVMAFVSFTLLAWGFGVQVRR
jgi:malonate transporter and related proteins